MGTCTLGVVVSHLPVICARVVRPVIFGVRDRFPKQERFLLQGSPRRGRRRMRQFHCLGQYCRLESAGNPESSRQSHIASYSIRESETCNTAQGTPSVRDNQIAVADLSRVVIDSGAKNRKSETATTTPAAAKTRLFLFSIANFLGFASTRAHCRKVPFTFMTSLGEFTYLKIHGASPDAGQAFESPEVGTQSSGFSRGFLAFPLILGG